MSKIEKDSDDKIAKIKSALNIIDLVSNDTDLKQTGDKYKGMCPVCHKDSLVVYSQTSSFYCFACGIGGDVINYIKESQKISYKDSLCKALELIGEKPSKDDIIQRIMVNAARFYHNELKTNAKANVAIDVIHSWGIKGKVVVNLGLGFHDDSFDCLIKTFISKFGYDKKTLESIGLIAKSSIGTYYDKFRNSIIIPSVGVDGKVKCFDFYAINEGVVYKSSCTQNFDRRLDLYSLNLAIKSKKKSVIIVSSYEDYFLLIGQGITNVVSTYLPRITEEQLSLLKRYFKVIIPFVPSHINFSLCYKYCKNNPNLYCGEIKMRGENTPKDFCQKHGNKDIIDLIDEFESAIR